MTCRGGILLASLAAIIVCGVFCANGAPPPRQDTDTSSQLTTLHFVRHHAGRPIIDLRIGEVWSSKKQLGQAVFNPWTIFHLRDVTVVIKENPVEFKLAGQSSDATGMHANAVEGDWWTWLNQLAAASDGGVPMEAQASNVDVTVGAWASTPFRLVSGNASVTYRGIELGGGVRLEMSDRVIQGHWARLSDDKSTLEFDSGETFGLPFPVLLKK